MSRSSHRRLFVALAALVAVFGGLAGAAAAPVSDEELEEFLRKAKVVSMEPIGTGVTRPKRVTLERDGTTLRAAFKTVGELRSPERPSSPSEVASLSTPKVARSWHELQLMLPSLDSRVS